MKFTQFTRESIVKAVMADVPFVDYMEKARLLANKQAVVLRKKAGIPEGMNERLCHKHVLILGSYTYVYGATGEEAQSIKDIPAIAALAALHKEQETKHSALQSLITSAMFSVNTLKQAMEAFPEFEKYYPKENVSVRSLPALTNVVSDFVKAGWPTKQAKITI
jgi:hypothetical protein